MSVFIAGENNGSYGLYDFKLRKLKWVNGKDLAKVRDEANKRILNAVVLEDGTIEPKKYMVRNGGRSLTKVEGKFKTIVLLDFNREQFAYIYADGTKKPMLHFLSFKELPYYDKPSEYGNIHYKKDTGEVITQAYIVRGQKSAFPIHFKTYIQDLVDVNSEASENEETAEDVEIEDVQGETVEEGTDSEIEAVVEEESKSLVVENEGVPDIKELVSKLVRWGKNEPVGIRAVSDIEIYKIMLLSQLDGSILYIPYEVLRIFKYRIEHILDRNMDMTTFVAIGTLKVDEHNLIVISRFDQSSNLIKLQIVKSSRPQKGKNYDMMYIKDNYIKINAMTSHIKLE